MLKALVLPILLYFSSGPVTMTSIDHIPGTDSLLVVIRFDYDLFLRDYQQTINDDINLNVLRNYNPFPADMANNYINLKTSIIVNDKPLIGKLLKIEREGGDVRLTLLYRTKGKIKCIFIRNKILTGLFSDVENLMIIKIDDHETGIKLTAEHDEAYFDMQHKRGTKNRKVKALQMP